MDLILRFDALHMEGWTNRQYQKGDLILRFDVLRTEVLWMVNIGQKYQSIKKGNN